MSKSIIALTVLVALALVAGCTDNRAVRLRYEAEKKLYQAEKTLSTAQVDPRSVEPGMLDMAREQLTEAAAFAVAAMDSIDRTASPVEYRELQMLAIQATAELNHLLYAQRRYDESIDILTRLLQDSELAPEDLMVARVNLGRSLQASGQWDRALSVYNTAVESYFPPLNAKGELIAPLFNLPAHIFEVAVRIGDSVSAQYEMQRAIAYYSDLATQQTSEQLVASSRAMLARLYDATGQWENEIAQLEALSDSTSQAYVSIRARIAEIYGLRLREFGKALGMYETLMARVGKADTAFYPDMLFKTALIKMEQKDYLAARSILIDLKRDFQRYYGTNPPAQLAMARTFELEKNWDRAEIEYSALIEGYRGSDEAMGALLYVAKHYDQIGRKDQADRWYRNAEEYYQDLAKADAGGLMEAKATSYRAELAARQQDWRGAAGLLTGLYQKFSRYEVGRQALLKAAGMHRERLGEPAVADSLIGVLKAALAEIETTPQL